MRRLVAAIVLALVLTACKPPVSPNFVVIITDDQALSTMDTMPAVQNLLAAHGMTFTNAFVTTPLCCPSRASFLTGQRASYHGVETNMDAGLLDPTTTIAVALQAKGYTTALVGKYLNGYTAPAFPLTPPVGWSSWFAFFGGERYYNYDVNVDGSVVSKGSGTADYSTDVFRDAAVWFIATAQAPFFAYIAPLAPHEPWIPAVRHAGMFAGRPCPATPATLEADTTDKPDYVQAFQEAAHEGQLEENCAAQNLRRETLLAVNDLVAAVVAAVEARGATVLRNTVFVFTSDNGLVDLEHWWEWKQVPYEASIRVPLVVRYDRWLEAQGETTDELVLNIDLAPTLAGMAGATLAYTDGDDWSDFYAGQTGWRVDFPLEYAPSGIPPAWTAVRAAGWKYVLYDDGFEELYDLVADPYELDNLAYVEPTPPLLAVARMRHTELHG